MAKNYYALKNIFDLVAIPAERRGNFAYDVLQAVEQVKSGTPLEKVHGAVTFNDLGDMNWQDTGHGFSLKSPEKSPQSRVRWEMENLTSLVNMYDQYLPQCLSDLVETVNAAERKALRDVKAAKEQGRLALDFSEQAAVVQKLKQETGGNDKWAWNNMEELPQRVEYNIKFSA